MCKQSHSILSQNVDSKGEECCTDETQCQSFTVLVYSQKLPHNDDGGEDFDGESGPEPARATERAMSFAVTTIITPTTFQPSVRYSSSNPRLIN